MAGAGGTGAMRGGGQAAQEPRARFTWRLGLTVFQRVVALGLLALGIVQWGYVMGAVDIGPAPFLELRPPVRNAIAVLAAADLVAAIGLWFCAAWGAAFWFIIAMTRTALHTAFAEVHGAQPVEVGIEVALLAVFLVLQVLSRREARAEEKASRQRRRQTQSAAPPVAGEPAAGR
ncbi:DUF6163 family protein [Prosthecomicrobium sp. N25]|uniref:DUF6163 family protein n=1 Tax=Prosthecomicrobium sp. N25 TaxID=3129254 RepID=UPI003077F9A0